jgi:hypothetical protein
MNEETVVVVEQPNYLPWLGYFDLIAQSDVWVWYDDVQYTRRDWRNRNRVAGPRESVEPVWLTVPVKSRGRYEQKICEVEIDHDRPWVRKHLETVRHCYGDAPWFGEVFALLSKVLARGHARLADLTIELNEELCRYLGLAPEFRRSSALGVAGDRQERLIEICRRLGATTYLSGPAARSYISPELFERAGLELRYIVYDYPPYDRGGRPFVPRLSILDPLVCLGPEETAAFLARHRRWEREPIAHLA